MVMRMPRLLVSLSLHIHLLRLGQLLEIRSNGEAAFTDDYGRVAATREQMSEARLPIAYRDGCANLLIPLNRCRYEEYYLPWKCEVCWH